MTIKKIIINISEEEWKQFPSKDRQRIRKLLDEMYGIDVTELIDNGNEGDK